MSTSRTRRVMLPLLAALALVLVFGGIRIFNEVAHTCGDQERAAFLEFPQYGGRVILPGNDIDSGGCVASFQAAGPHEDVIRYYKHQLEQHGWTTQGFEGGAAEGEGAPAGGGSLPASVVLSAERGIGIMMLRRPLRHPNRFGRQRVMTEPWSSTGLRPRSLRAIPRDERPEA